MIGQRRMELMDQVTMRAMNLNRVESGFNSPARSFLEGLYEIFHFVSGECLGHFVMGTERDCRRGYRRLGILRLSAGMAELDTDLGSVRMHCFDNTAVGRNLIVVPDPGILIRYASVRMNARHFHNNEASTSHGTADVMHKMPIIRNPVPGLNGILTHRWHNNAVLEGQILEIVGCKQVSQAIISFHIQMIKM